MKKIMFAALLLALAGSAFSGTVFGSLILTSPSTDTAFVIVFHDFASLYDSMLFYSEVYSPDYEWTISDPGIIDGYDFNAMGIIPSRLPPNPGDPAGQYPGNPFQLSGGSIAGIDIPLDTIGEIHGTIEYAGPIDSLMLGLYNYYPYLLGLPPTLTESYHIHSLDYAIENIPAGAYAARAWADLNGNGYFDSTGTLVEPFGWAENDMGGIVQIGGGCSSSVNIVIPPSGIGEEKPPLPERIGVHCFPNPFNGAATIVVVANGAPVSAGIYDLSGKLVYRLFDDLPIDGIRAFRFIPPKGFPSGSYFIRVHGGATSAERQIIYLK